MNTEYPFIVVYRNEPNTQREHYELLVNLGKKDLYVSLPVGANISNLATKVDEYLNFIDEKFTKNPNGRLDNIKNALPMSRLKGVRPCIDILTENDSKMLFGFLDRSDKKSA